MTLVGKRVSLWAESTGAIMVEMMVEMTVYQWVDLLVESTVVLTAEMWVLS